MRIDACADAPPSLGVAHVWLDIKKGDLWVYIISNRDVWIS